MTLSTGINQRDARPLGIERVVEAQWGREGLERMAPLRTLLDNGIPFHIEGSEPDDDRRYPTWYMHLAVTRISKYGDVVAPDQVLGESVGFFKFDGNIMDVPIEKLPDLKPVMTLVGGQIAYESKAL